jgi:hypothetical protein
MKQNSVGFSPGGQLAMFLAKYNPEIAALAESVLIKMRERLPGYLELVYDNYNALAIGFGPTPRASDALFSVAVYPRWVSLFSLMPGDCAIREKSSKATGHERVTSCSWTPPASTIR